MEIMTVQELSNLDIRDLLVESGCPLEGFIISRDDFSSIRVIAVQYLAKEQVSLEKALQWAFFKRMEFTGRMETVLRAVSDYERYTLSAVAFTNDQIP